MFNIVVTMQKKYYHSNFEKRLNQIQKKTKFLAFRLEEDKFNRLNNEAQQLGVDLSTLIRNKLGGKDE